jgi:hypothetical protein
MRPSYFIGIKKINLQNWKVCLYKIEQLLLIDVCKILHSTTCIKMFIFDNLQTEKSKCKTETFILFINTLLVLKRLFAGCFETVNKLQTSISKKLSRTLEKR